MKNNKVLFKENSQVTMLRSTKSVWGSFGLVQATLNALSFVTQNGNFDRVVLLSGQDYPIKSNDAIDEFFNVCPYSNFLESFALPDYDKWHDDVGNYRINKYYLGPSSFAKYSAKTINFLSSWLRVFKRKLNLGIQHYHGSQWWILDMPAVEYILDFVYRYPFFTAFHRYTFAPDEVFFQTILLNANDAGLKKSILNNNKRFMKWQSSGSAHPESLQLADADEIRSSDDLFARKFDDKGGSVLMDMIDRDCLAYTGR